MREPSGPSGVEAALAYALSAAGTMLWVGCVLPAGKLVDQGLLQDLATPMYRQSILLVPGLLLLILGPVSAVISRGISGRRGVLAATDTFVCLYASIAITVRGRGQGATFWVLTAFMAVLGVLSAVETGRYARAAARGLPPPHVKGLRLALAMLVLLMPSWFLVEEGRELASLVVPFGFVALSAAGARMARTALGLRRVAALQHLIVAGHLFVTLRYTVMDEAPRFSRIGIPGWSVVIGAAVLAFLALARLVILLRRRGGWTEAPEEPAEEPGAVRPAVTP